MYISGIFMSAAALLTVYPKIPLLCNRDLQALNATDLGITITSSLRKFSANAKNKDDKLVSFPTGLIHNIVAASILAYLLFIYYISLSSFDR